MVLAQYLGRKLGNTEPNKHSEQETIWKQRQEQHKIRIKKKREKKCKRA